MVGEEESILLELGKVKPITEEEDQSNKAEYVDSSKNFVQAEEPKVIKNPSPSWRRRHPCLACCGVCGLLVLLIVVVIIILAFTLFKVKEPRLHVDNISLEALNFSLPFNIPFSVSLNATLRFQLSLENPNRASITYHNSTAHMFYRDTEVGLLPIPAGHVGARGTEQISLTIDLMADRLVASPYILSDLTNGSLPFSTTSRLSGKAKILRIFKHHVVTSSVCNTTLFISNQTISNPICTYDIHL